MNWSVAKIGTIYQKPAYAIGLSTPPPPPIGCVLYMPGLPGAGNKIYDRSPYGNHGTITGAVWKRLPSGLWLLDFDGADDYVNIPDTPSLDITNQLTLEAWAYHDIEDAIENVIAKRVEGSDDAYALYHHSSNTFTFLVFDAITGHATNSTDTFAKEEWHHIVGTYDHEFTRVYVDGALNCTPVAHTFDLRVTVDPVRIGWGHSDTYAWDGRIALPRIHNRALSALEIQNHYQQEKYLFGVW